MVRYKVKADRAAENEALVRGVYEELHRTDPDGIKYATFVLPDGVTFIHLAVQSQEDGAVRLTELESFGEFQAGIADRCEQPPVVSELREVGSFKLAGD
jgi:hypothetical protein